MKSEEIRAFFNAHTPYVDSWECELCGSHQEWTCSCGWSESSRTGNSFADWLDHVLEGQQK